MTIESLLGPLIIVIGEWVGIAYLHAGLTRSPAALMERLFRAHPVIGRWSDDARRRMYRMVGTAILLTVALILFGGIFVEAPRLGWVVQRSLGALMGSWYAGEAVWPTPGGPILRFLLRQTSGERRWWARVLRGILVLSGIGLLWFAMGGTDPQE